MNTMRLITILTITLLITILIITLINNVAFVQKGVKEQEGPKEQRNRLQIVKKQPIHSQQENSINLASDDSYMPFNLNDYPTPLMEAIEHNEPPLEVGRLIAEGADVNAVYSEQPHAVKPVLRYALDRGTDPESVEIIRMLIQAGADANQNTYNRVTDKQVYGFMPLLTYAVIYSSAEIVQILIDAGARDDLMLIGGDMAFKKTALAIAQKLGKTDVIKVLKRGQ